MSIRRSSPEFLVNTATANSQSQSSVSVLDDGRILVTWTDNSQTAGDTSLAAIRGRIFNSNGTPSVAEFVVNTTTEGGQSESATTVLDDGRFVVTWTDNSNTDPDTTGGAIRAGIFNADGTPSVPEFVVNETTTSLQLTSAVTALEGDRFLVTWTDFSRTGGDTSVTAVRGRIFNGDGSEDVPEFLVNTTTAFDQGDSAVARLQNGGFVVCWSDNSQTAADTSDFAVRARIFDAFGVQVAGEFVVNSTTAASQFDANIAVLRDGRFVVSWTDFSGAGADNDFSAIRARIFNPNGTQSVAEFEVNVSTLSLQVSSRVAALADGRFVVLWTDNSQSGDDTSDFAIRARIFNPDGTEAVAEFVVAETVAADQREGSIDVLDDGRFVVTWTDGSQSGGDTSADAVRAQVFDPTAFRGTRADEEVTGGTLEDRYTGGGGNDTLAGMNGNDRLQGDRGRDRLDGGRGADRIDGGSGDDTLTGGSGADWFQFRDGFGRDRVTDFAQGADLLDFSANGGVSGFAALDIRVLGGNTLVEAPDGSRITLAGFTGTLTEDDFLF